MQISTKTGLNVRLEEGFGIFCSKPCQKSADQIAIRINMSQFTVTTITEIVGHLVKNKGSAEYR